MQSLGSEVKVDLHRWQGRLTPSDLFLRLPLVHVLPSVMGQHHVQHHSHHSDPLLASPKSSHSLSNTYPSRYTAPAADVNAPDHDHIDLLGPRYREDANPHYSYRYRCEMEVWVSRRRRLLNGLDLGGGVGRG